jgi:hypothetical protein
MYTGVVRAKRARMEPLANHLLGDLEQSRQVLSTMKW